MNLKEFYSDIRKADSKSRVQLCRYPCRHVRKGVENKGRSHEHHT